MSGAEKGIRVVTQDSLKIDVSNLNPIELPFTLTSSDGPNTLRGIEVFKQIISKIDLDPILVEQLNKILEELNALETEAKNFAVSIDENYDRQQLLMRELDRFLIKISSAKYSFLNCCTTPLKDI